MASQQQVPQGQPLELAPRGNMALTLADSFLNDLDEFEEDNDEEQQQEETNEELANDLEESDDDTMEDVLKNEGVDAKIKLQTSERYRRHMTAIAERCEKPASFDDEEEYALIVESNEILVKMDAELHEVHAYVNDLYGKKFPELETLVPSKIGIFTGRRADGQRDGHDAGRLVRYLTTDRGHGRVRDGEYDIWPAFDRVGARGMYARV